MKRRAVFTTEAELVERAAEWLRADGWEPYFEVAPWGSGGSRADIVGTRGSLLCVVECKLSLSLAVLHQCQTWRRFSNMVWAAVPIGRERQFGQEVAEWLGTGVLELGFESWARHRVVQPALQRKIEPKLRGALNDAQRRTPAGARADYSTPFRETCTRLLVAVKEAGGRLAVKEAMTALQHHYSSAACARSSLIEHTERGVIAGLRIARAGKAVFFELAKEMG